MYNCFISILKYQQHNKNNLKRNVIIWLTVKEIHFLNI